jgi:hypothetical protein
VLLTRYTFVNTLQRMKPLLMDWTLPLPADGRAQPPAGAAGIQIRNPATPAASGGSRGGTARGAGPQPRPAAAIGGGGRQALERGASATDAAQKRDNFMTRMSRRVMRNAAR